MLRCASIPSVLVVLLACGPAAAPQERTEEPGAPRTGGWRLATVDSPYLRGHADNPVTWYPWGEEAFARAAELDRPIFLSIGYSSCHWCHVMEHETFEDPESARLLDEHFVSIKVDREERPDVDARYMGALQLITRNAGWPASLFLTPDGRPFAGGTYFPPVARDGLPGFRDVLRQLHDAWTKDRERVLKSAASVTAAIDIDELPAAGEHDAAETLVKGTAALVESLDPVFGGTVGSQKFPPALLLGTLLRQHVRGGIDLARALDATLDAMAAGGLADHVGGGFHRYCVDPRWEVPHFEKMLYDNALLAVVYAEAAVVFADASRARTARETLAWLRRDMLTADGLYASARDADSLPFDAQGRPLPGERKREGCVYLWTVPELQAVLGEAEGEAFARLYGANATGNFEHGASILRLPRPLEALLAQRDEHAARLAGLPAEADAALAFDADARRRLRAARDLRPQAFRDDKGLAGWNGLTLSAFARVGALLDEAELVAEARRLAHALAPLERRGPDGALRLAHQAFEGRPSGTADLFDHAALALGLLDAYEAVGDASLLLRARALALALLDGFQDPEGGFFDTRGDDPHLAGRGRLITDSVLPSGTTLAVQLLLRLAPLDDEGRFAEAARRALARLGPLMREAPRAFAGGLTALDLAQGPLLEIVLDGDDGALGRLVRTRLLPAALLVPDAGALSAAFAAAGLPEPALLAGRHGDAQGARAFVCVRGTCLLPATDGATLLAQIERLGAR